MKFPKIFASCAALLAMLSSCSSWVNDSEGDCSSAYDVKFKYVHHLKYGDAFPYEGESVNLYVFDADDRLAATISEPLTSENAGDFTLRLPASLKPGTYRLLAWCGVKDNDAFTVNPGARSSDPAHISSHSCYFNRNEAGEIHHNIRNLFHGSAYVTIKADDYGVKTTTIPLVKDTNIFRIVLQQKDGAKLNPDDFEFTIEYNNGHLDPENYRLPDDNLVYHDFRKEGVTAHLNFPAVSAGSGIEGQEITDGGSSSVINGVAAEISTGRLFDDNGAVLRVRNLRTNQYVIRALPVIDLALMTKNFDGYSMPDQEYLDRQARYTMTFLLDDNNLWTTTQIHINKWFVVYQTVTPE